MLPDTKLAYSLREAVEATGIPRSTFFACFKTGELKPRRTGRRLIILRADLEDFLKNLPPRDASRKYYGPA